MIFPHRLSLVVFWELFGNALSWNVCVCVCVSARGRVCVYVFAYVRCVCVSVKLTEENVSFSAQRKCEMAFSEDSTVLDRHSASNCLTRLQYDAFRRTVRITSCPRNSVCECTRNETKIERWKAKSSRETRNAIVKLTAGQIEFFFELSENSSKSSLLQASLALFLQEFPQR